MDARELGRQFALGEVAKDVRDVNGMEHDKNGKFASKGSFGGVAKGSETNNASKSLEENDTLSQVKPEGQKGKKNMNKSEIVQFLRKLADAVERAQNEGGEAKPEAPATDDAKTFSKIGSLPKAPASTGKPYKVTGPRLFPKKVDTAKIGKGLAKLKV